MLDLIWLLLIAAGVCCAAFSGDIGAVTEAAFAAGETALGLAIDLAGTMAVWMGLLNLAEKAGLVASLGRLLQPLLRRLFPDVPPGHPAMGAIVMNVSANILGLGNAATPFGLRAMQQLSTLSDERKRASDAMITFLVLNTSCLTLLPTLVLSLRTEAGSADPAEIVPATLLATALGMTAALGLDRLLRGRLP